MVALDQIELTGEIRQQLMRVYVQMLIENKKPPPVKLIRQSNTRYLVYDGNHRVSAARSIQRKVIKAELVPMPEGAEK
jgi:hypothetical protein